MQSFTPTNTSSAIKKVQLPAIQILRGVAALAIAVAHAIQEAEKAIRRAGGNFPYDEVIPLGAGVDLFFVISGFVMVYASANLFGRNDAPAQFMLKRLARIAPIYWALTIVYVLLSVLGLAPLNRSVPDMMEVICSFLFIPYAQPGGAIQPAFSLGWTLNYEMFFYCLFAAVLPFRRSVAVPLLAGVMLLLVLLGMTVSYTSTQLFFWTRPIILEFVAGMLIGQLALRGFRLSRPSALMLMIMAIVFLAAGKLVPQFLPTERAFLYGIPGAMLVLAALSYNDADFSGRFSNLLVKLGDASYALYLFHPFALRGVMVIAGSALVALSPWIFILVSVTLACIAAYFIWLWFERPVTKALQGLGGRGS